MIDSDSLPNFLAVDFYCGAGGSTRGLLDAGGYVIAGIDNDEDCRATYQQNNCNLTLDRIEPSYLALDMFPAQPNYPNGQQQEIRASLERLIPRYRQMAPDVPLLFVICAPCQSFTRFVQRQLTSGQAQSRDRDQNLLLQTASLVEEFRPEMVISENVVGIRNGKFRPIWEEFQSRLRNLGYAVGDNVVCASRFGVPQYRRRSIILAFRNEVGYGQIFNLPVPDHDPSSPQISASEAIGHLPPLQAGETCAEIPSHACRNLSEISRMRLMSVKPGESNFGFAETAFGDLSLACHRRLAEKGKRGFGDVYTRIDPSRPSPTITTRFFSVSNGRFGHYEQEQVRGLSLREGAALQSFPDDYEFYGNGMETIAKMIGNAVPPRLSSYMAQWLLNLWKDVGNTGHLFKEGAKHG